MSRPYSNDLRERVIKNYEEGMPKEKLVEIFKIGISTLNRWIRNYLKTGSIEPRKRSRYRKRKVEDEDLKKYIEAHPSATLEQMAQHFKVRAVSIWHRLKKLGITRKKKTFLYEERNEAEREEFVKKLEEKKDNPIVFVDESGIKNDLKNEYGRSPRGVKIEEDKKGRATEKVNLVAGLLDGELIAPFVYDCNTNAEVFNIWLEECLIPVLPPNCIIVLDNARFHKSPKTLEIIEKNGHQLLFLPPYSPDLNPIEKCWAVIKRKLKNLLMQCDNIYAGIESVFQTN
jgi:transposase